MIRSESEGVYPVHYVYDEVGKLTEIKQGETAGESRVTKYEYDANGNLLSVELPNGTQIEYVIDPRNRRVAKTVDGVTTQKFLYLNQLNPVAELDGDGNIVSLFVYGTRSNVPDYMIKNGQKYKFVTNHLGSVVKVINVDSGEVAQEITYNTFGKILTDSNAQFQPFRLAGGIYDVDTQLIRFGARDYDPNSGRWTSKDPIKFDGGRNFYGYCNGDPVNKVDVNGLLPDWFIFSSDFWEEFAERGADTLIGIGDSVSGGLTKEIRDYFDLDTPCGFNYEIGKIFGDFASFFVNEGIIFEKINILGKGSTGRVAAKNLKEQLAMKEVISDPLENAIDITNRLSNGMSDNRWLGSDGWIKMQRVFETSNKEKIIIHFNYNKVTGDYDDFKFK